jgi:single-strand DNA-binding protein
MKDLNEIRLTGRLTRDPEAKTFENGNVVVKFSLAVDRGRDANKKDKGAYFVPCQAWGKTGELAMQWARKGKKILVTGKLFVSEYEKDGQRKTFTAVDVDNFWLMERPEARPEMSDEMPFEAGTNAPVTRPTTTAALKQPTTTARPAEREPGDDFDGVPF